MQEELYLNLTPCLYSWLCKKDTGNIDFCLTKVNVLVKRKFRLKFLENGQSVPLPQQEATKWLKDTSPWLQRLCENENQKNI